MAVKYTQRLCRHCDHLVLAQRQKQNDILHLLMSLVTAGLWIPVWIIMGMVNSGWRCPQCGSKTVAKPMFYRGA